MPVQVRLKIDLNWLEHEGFKVLVEEIWGFMAVIFSVPCMSFPDVLCVGEKEVFGNVLH